MAYIGFNEEEKLWELYDEETGRSYFIQNQNGTKLILIDIARK